MHKRVWFWVLMAFVLAGCVRGAVLQSTSIWVDEAFSLAMATGHSLEHPAADARPELGDFVQDDKPQLASSFHRYLSHRDPPASLSEVIRAVSISDTSPPLYYILLSGWTRLVGTTDAALRGFTLLCTLLSLPLVARLAGRCGGRSAIGPAVLFAALNPMWTYYGTEGRMYGLLLLLIMAQAVLTCALGDHAMRLPSRPWKSRVVWAAWVLCAAAGMLTHYFFVFPFAAMGLWLLRVPRRWRAILAVVLVGALISPWYWRVPEALGAWRITAGWLEIRPSAYSEALVPWRLFQSYLSTRGVWGSPGKSEYAVSLLLILCSVLLLATWRKRLLTGPRALLWLWLIISIMGPLIFDLWRGTHTGAIMRYGIGGLPAVIILLSMSATRLKRWPRYMIVAAMLACWVMPTLKMMNDVGRAQEPYAQAARYIDERATDRTVVVVHTIPSGLLSLARYMQSDLPVYPWVGQLDERQSPRDALMLIDTYDHIIFVNAHAIGEPAPEQAVFEKHLFIHNSGRQQHIELTHYSKHPLPQGSR